MKIVSIPVKETTKQERDFYKSTDDLMEAMRELVLVEKMTGRTGLTRRINLAFTDVLRYAMKLAKAQV